MCFTIMDGHMKFGTYWTYKSFIALLMNIDNKKYGNDAWVCMAGIPNIRFEYVWEAHLIFDREANARSKDSVTNMCTHKTPNSNWGEQM